MIVCHCKVVSDRCITHSVGAGARTLAQVCSDTGAGRDCGGCVSSVKRVLVDRLDERQAVTVPLAVPVA